MSYSSESVLPASVTPRHVVEIIRLMRFKKVANYRLSKLGQVEEWNFFDDQDYRSWSGVELWLYIDASKRVVIETRTSIGRSYYDLKHQNDTIALIRRRFGGTFTTDEGRTRYLRVPGPPPPPAASGCYLAHHRFGRHLFRAKNYLEARRFKDTGLRIDRDSPRFLQDLDPTVLGNNTLMPYFVAAIEDYFKSVFVALLRYSNRKSQLLRAARLGGDDLVRMSERQLSLEEAIAESVSFQRLESICSRFDELMPRLNLAAVLQRPYRRRRETLYDTLRWMITTRHAVIHRATLDLELTDERMNALIYDLASLVARVQKAVCAYHGWPVPRSGWHLGQEKRRVKSVGSLAGIVEQAIARTEASAETQ